jgi:hypothetical protein
MKCLPAWSSIALCALPTACRTASDVALPEREGRPIRLIDPVIQASGLPREVPRADGPPDDPFGTNNKAAQIADLKNDPLLFPPGTAVFYSNYGFDLLGTALANAGHKPYAELLKERVFDPLGMKDTGFNPRPSDDARFMQGHNFDSSTMVTAHTPTSIECAGGLYTSQCLAHLPLGLPDLLAGAVGIEPLQMPDAAPRSTPSCWSITPSSQGARALFCPADQKHRLGRDPNEPFRHAAEEQAPEAAPAVRADHDEIGGPARCFLLDCIVDAIAGFGDRKKRCLGLGAEIAGRRSTAAQYVIA